MKTNYDDSQIAQKQIKNKILAIRGQKVILDADLADIYGVETKILNKAISRNMARFPEDFVFRLTKKEFDTLRFQNGTSKSSRGGRRYPPYAFTEHGAIMAANVLRSIKAEEMSVFVVRAFVKMREQLTLTQEMAKRLAEIEKTLIVHDSALVDLYKKIRPLLLPPKVPQKPPIGFLDKNKKTKYTVKRESK